MSLAKVPAHMMPEVWRRVEALEEIAPRRDSLPPLTLNGVVESECHCTQRHKSVAFLLDMRIPSKDGEFEQALFEFCLWLASIQNSTPPECLQSYFLENLPFEPPTAFVDAARKALPTATADDMRLLARAVNYHFLKLLRPDATTADREEFLAVLGQLNNLPDIRRHRPPDGLGWLSVQWDYQHSVMAVVLGDHRWIDERKKENL